MPNLVKNKDICNDDAEYTEKQKAMFKKLIPESNLTQIQNYVNEILKARGLSSQHIQSRMLLLTEEVGELAKSIRKILPNSFVDKERLENYDTVENEIADVFIVLISIANQLQIDLFSAFVEKERKNINRKWQINES
ncbi:MAG: hypothetical protein LBH37_04760 [Oscillospiraceae bacterium]|jgi:NTP pyrophosphatase (non-canonical NTP hydrolase)|nr:hypothetical protein [Oscillospiraceae bacterium]